MDIPTLATARLRLRPLRAHDLDAFAAIWADPDVTRHVGGAPRPRDNTWLRMLATEGHWRWFGYGYWAVERDGELIGNAGFATFHRPLDPPLDAPEAGWAFAAHAWGQGYATEIVARLARYADDRGWPETICIIDLGNAASARVAVKAGFVLLRDAVMGTVATRVFARRRGGTAN